MDPNSELYPGPQAYDASYRHYDGCYDGHSHSHSLSHNHVYAPPPQMQTQTQMQGLGHTYGHTHAYTGAYNYSDHATDADYDRDITDAHSYHPYHTLPYTTQPQHQPQPQPQPHQSLLRSPHAQHPDFDRDRDRPSPFAAAPSLLPPRYEHAYAPAYGPPQSQPHLQPQHHMHPHAYAQPLSHSHSHSHRSQPPYAFRQTPSPTNPHYPHLQQYSHLQSLPSPHQSPHAALPHFLAADPSLRKKNMATCSSIRQDKIEFALQFRQFLDSIEDPEKKANKTHLQALFEEWCKSLPDLPLLTYSECLFGMYLAGVLKVHKNGEMTYKVGSPSRESIAANFSKAVPTDQHLHLIQTLRIAIQRLKKDNLPPTLNNIRQQIIESHGTKKLPDVQWRNLTNVLNWSSAFINLTNDVAAVKTQLFYEDDDIWAFTDITSPEDPYPHHLWQALCTFLETPIGKQCNRDHSVIKNARAIQRNGPQILAHQPVAYLAHMLNLLASASLSYDTNTPTNIPTPQASSPALAMFLTHTPSSTPTHTPASTPTPGYLSAAAPLSASTTAHAATATSAVTQASVGGPLAASFMGHHSQNYNPHTYSPELDADNLSESSLMSQSSQQSYNYFLNSPIKVPVAYPSLANPIQSARLFDESTTKSTNQFTRQVTMNSFNPIPERTIISPAVQYAHQTSIGLKTQVQGHTSLPLQPPAPSASIQPTLSSTRPLTNDGLDSRLFSSPIQHLNMTSQSMSSADPSQQQQQQQQQPISARQQQHDRLPPPGQDEDSPQRAESQETEKESSPSSLSTSAFSPFMGKPPTFPPGAAGNTFSNSFGGPLSAASSNPFHMPSLFTHKIEKPN